MQDEASGLVPGTQGGRTQPTINWMGGIGRTGQSRKTGQDNGITGWGRRGNTETEEAGQEEGRT